jgi:hypothetical protein
MAVLLAAAAVGAVARASDASIVGRVGGVFAALVLVVIAAGVVRGGRWAYGAAFLIAVCWFWAVLALRVQAVVSWAEATIWLSWAVALGVASVIGREPEPPGPRFPPMTTSVGEDVADGG